MARAVVTWDHVRCVFVDGDEYGSHYTSMTWDDTRNIITADVAKLGTVADAGLLSRKATLEGLVDVEAILPADARVVLHAGRSTALAGEVSRFGYYQSAAAKEVHKVGQHMAFTCDLTGDGPQAKRATVLENQYENSAGAAIARTSAGSSTPLEIGTVPTGSYLIGCVSLKAFTGTSITFLFESDVTGGFSGSEVARLSFGPLSAKGAQIQYVAGPITPADFYRVRTTGTFSSARYLASVAIVTEVP